ncbi:MAG: 5-(carboxyamino)imidazole ribonucleotide synthase [Pseudomonadota bacterium]
MTAHVPKPLPPGSTIGIIGGGQLGRMLVIAAATLGYRIHIFAPDDDSCAAEISATVTRAAYSDRTALAAFADSVDVATFEFENIDAAPLVEVASRVSLWPPLAALEIGQDRITEKCFAGELGARTAQWAPVSSRAELDGALAKIGVPAILKTTRFGYDGKGQARIKDEADVDAAWAAIAGRPAILEAMVPFDHEFSLIVARDQYGTISFWEAPENVHKAGILATSVIPPSDIILQQIPAARGLARRLAEKLDYVGVFTIEFFASDDGPVFNEMAPRVHNSGHWTIEGAVTSQFENHIRAVAGLPLGSTKLTGSSVLMKNIIGHDADDWLAMAADSGTHLHLYGKDEARDGRKMGHITRVIY